ncbi:MAG TPA: hypothetical protein VFS20_13130 [Longimicrobium sp.]|nr:hypothetical protein [Longimicrobium sp.]
MKKLKLDLDDLRVDSFDTGRDLPRGGTVHGLAVFRESIDSCELTRVGSEPDITCQLECTGSLGHTYCLDNCSAVQTNAPSCPCEVTQESGCVWTQTQ